MEICRKRGMLLCVSLCTDSLDYGGYDGDAADHVCCVPWAISQGLRLRDAGRDSLVYNKGQRIFIRHEPNPCPEKFVITFAVMLRYIPTVQEDWHFIKDAMRMRDVSPSLGGFLSHPGMTVECIYVPLMMMASKAADELSIASVTRGIENPNPRTCLVQIKCGIADWTAMLFAVAFFILNYVSGEV